MSDYYYCTHQNMVIELEKIKINLTKMNVNHRQVTNEMWEDLP